MRKPKYCLHLNYEFIEDCYYQQCVGMYIHSVLLPLCLLLCWKLHFVRCVRCTCQSDLVDKIVSTTDLMTQYALMSRGAMTIFVSTFFFFCSFDFAAALSSAMHVSLSFLPFVICILQRQISAELYNSSKLYAKN